MQSLREQRKMLATSRSKREANGSQREGRAKSLFYLASILKKVTWKIKHSDAKISQRKAKEMPKGAKKRPMGGQRQPKGGKSKARGSPGGGKMYPKKVKHRSCIWNAFLEAFEQIRANLGKPFWLLFGFTLGPKFYIFPCYFLASFFD